MELGEKLDVRLAWNKTKFAYGDRSFVDSPYFVDLLNENRGEWLSRVEEDLNQGYNTNNSRIADMPKGNFHVRPVSILKISDSLIYSALLVELHEDIAETISWSEGIYRYSHILKQDIEDKKWLEYYYDYWQSWNDKSRRLISEDYNYVVFSDVAGFYENISIKRLISDLRQISDKDEVINQLRDCLQTWAEPRNSGIPQGYYPSDILAEVYHNSIDKRLSNNGYKFLRYNDDLRIFTETKEEAKLALKYLSNLYREKGLNLHSAKTSILAKNKAEKRIDEVDDNIKKIQEAQEATEIDWDAEWEEVISYGDESKENEERKEDKRPSQDLVEDAFKKFYIDDEEEGNKHLFRFLVSNLGYHKSQTGVEYCINHIKEGRRDISKILEGYFSELDNKKDIGDMLAEMLANDELIYSYQTYYIVRWLFEEEIRSEKILTAIRSCLDKAKMQETRNYCIAYLGEFGDNSDLDKIQKEYHEEISPVTKSIIVIALYRMEKSRRNAFYGRIEDDHEFVRYAIEKAKNKSH